jgi:uncharacterized membrane protein
MTADAWWGIAAVVWLVTGLWRLFGSTEKSTGYYLANHAFYGKMGLFVAILALEAWPMLTLIRWRMGRTQPHARDLGRIEVISYVECALVVATVFAAVAMSRGLGMSSGSPAAAESDAFVAMGDSVEFTAPDTKPSSGERDTVSRQPSSPPNANTPGAGAPAAPATPASPADLESLSSEMTMPLAGLDPMKLKSSFNDLRGGTRRHEALDIMAPRRTPIVSATAGRVLKLFTSKAGGLMVYATEPNERFILMYAHLDSYAAGLREGDVLTKGQLIGYVGFTGNASPSAPHLHLAIARAGDVRQWWKGIPVDPLPVLQSAVSRRR